MCRRCQGELSTSGTGTCLMQFYSNVFPASTFFNFLSFLLRETNLKFKMALEVTHRYLQEESAMADFNGSCSYILTAVQRGLRQFTGQVNKPCVGTGALPAVLVVLELGASWLSSRGSVSKLHEGVVLLSNIQPLKRSPLPWLSCGTLSRERGALQQRCPAALLRTKSPLAVGVRPGTSLLLSFSHLPL